MTCVWCDDAPAVARGLCAGCGADLVELEAAEAAYPYERWVADLWALERVVEVARAALALAVEVREQGDRRRERGLEVRVRKAIERADRSGNNRAAASRPGPATAAREHAEQDAVAAAQAAVTAAIGAVVRHRDAWQGYAARRVREAQTLTGARGTV